MVLKGKNPFRRRTQKKSEPFDEPQIPERKKDRGETGKQE